MLIVDRERAIVELEGFNDDLGLERPVAAVPRLDLGTGRKQLDPFRRVFPFEAAIAARLKIAVAVFSSWAINALTAGDLRD